mmetsp:Transcript_40124/g.60239  ORF Transcript_40124/g.60239 Transcript_40124/m.60239 type:complete len:89 (+) Transcript_40124:412-678(+)
MLNLSFIAAEDVIITACSVNIHLINAHLCCLLMKCQPYEIEIKIEGDCNRFPLGSADIFLVLCSQAGPKFEQLSPWAFPPAWSTYSRI